MSNINNIIRYICEMQSLDQMLQYYYQALVPGHPTPEQLNQILSNPQLMQDLDPTNPQNFLLNNLQTKIQILNNQFNKDVFWL